MITLTEIEEIVQNWKVLNLEQVFEDLVPISLCLQTQIKYNENKDLLPQFKRASIPLLVRIFGESKAYKRNRFVNYFETCYPQIAILKTKFEDTKGDLQQEADIIAKLAAELTKEIDYLFSDVMNEEITFCGLGCLNDGTITFSFSR